MSSMATKTLASALDRRLSAPLRRLRPLAAAAARPPAAGAGARFLSSRPAVSSLNDQSPSWSNRPPKETILLDGCDFEHWLIVVEAPDANATRDAIIDGYIKTLAQLFSVAVKTRQGCQFIPVSTKHYFAFGCKVSEELSIKIKTLPNVRWVLPDSYLDVKNKDYGGEPFIDGMAAPYDPKYHEEWLRNYYNSLQPNQRPRNDRTRNFRQRDSTQNFQNRNAPPMQNRDFQNRDPQAATNLNPSHNANAGPPGGAPMYQNQMPKTQQGYAPSAPGYQGNTRGYQGGGSPTTAPPGGPGYPGNGQAYQGGNAGYQGAVPAYQGGNQSYQGNQGGNPQGYQGGVPGYNQQGGGPAYQGGNQSYQGNQGGNQQGFQGDAPGYNQQGGQSGYQGGNNRSGNYQGDNAYQPSGYQGGVPNYQQQPSTPFQVQDIPGRDQY